MGEEVSHFEMKKKGESNMMNPNRSIIEGLSLFEREKRSGGDRQLACTIKKAIKSIENCSFRIASGEEAKKLKGVGEFIGKKIDEILKSPCDTNTQFPENSSQMNTANSFQLPIAPVYLSRNSFPPTTNFFPTQNYGSRFSLSNSSQAGNTVNTVFEAIQSEVLLFGAEKVPRDSSEWLNDIGFFQYYEAFKAAGYWDVRSIVDLSEEDLDSIGIFLPGHRKSLMVASFELKKVLLVQAKSAPSNFPQTLNATSSLQFGDRNAFSPSPARSLTPYLRNAPNFASQQLTNNSHQELHSDTRRNKSQSNHQMQFTQHSWNNDTQSLPRRLEKETHFTDFFTLSQPKPSLPPLPYGNLNQQEKNQQNQNQQLEIGRIQSNNLSNLESTIKETLCPKISEEFIKRQSVDFCFQIGKKLFSSASVCEFKEIFLNEKEGWINCRVKDEELGNAKFLVELFVCQQNENKKIKKATCTCESGYEGWCEHIVSLLFFLLHRKNGRDEHVESDDGENGCRAQNETQIGKSKRKQNYSPKPKTCAWAVLIVLGRKGGFLTKKEICGGVSPFIEKSKKFNFSRTVKNLVEREILEKKRGEDETFGLTSKGKKLFKEIKRNFSKEIEKMEREQVEESDEENSGSLVPSQNLVQERGKEDMQIFEMQKDKREEEEMREEEIREEEMGEEQEMRQEEVRQVVLLLDVRELKKKNPKSNFFEMLQKANVKCESRQLGLGDFLWVVREKGKKELVLDYIIERKTISDLLVNQLQHSASNSLIN